MIPLCITREQVAIYQSMRGRDRWLGSTEIAEAAGISPRTAREHLRRLTDLGVTERATLHPGYRYRLQAHTKAAQSYRLLIEQAETIYDGLR